MLLLLILWRYVITLCYDAYVIIITYITEDVGVEYYWYMFAALFFSPLILASLPRYFSLIFRFFHTYVLLLMLLYAVIYAVAISLPAQRG